jgi:hypothetical protein
MQNDTNEESLYFVLPICASPRCRLRIFLPCYTIFFANLYPIPRDNEIVLMVAVSLLLPRTIYDCTKKYLSGFTRKARDELSHL